MNTHTGQSSTLSRSVSCQCDQPSSHFHTTDRTSSLADVPFRCLSGVRALTSTRPFAKDVAVLVLTRWSSVSLAPGQCSRAVENDTKSRFLPFVTLFTFELSTLQKLTKDFDDISEGYARPLRKRFGRAEHLHREGRAPVSSTAGEEKPESRGGRPRSRAAAERGGRGRIQAGRGSDRDAAIGARLRPTACRSPGGWRSEPAAAAGRTAPPAERLRSPAAAPAA